MKQNNRILLLICTAFLFALPSCSDMKQKMQQKVKGKIVRLAKIVAEKRQAKAVADSTMQSDKTAVGIEAPATGSPSSAGSLPQPVPAPPGSIMADCPSLPSAADLIAGNTAAFAGRLTELRNQNRSNYYKKQKALARDCELMDVFGHTQAEVDKMNEDQKNNMIMKAFTKQKQRDAQQQAQFQEINKKISSAQEGGLMGIALMLGEMKESNKIAAKEAEVKFFEDNKELVEGIDRYKAQRKKVDELVVSRKLEVEEEVNSWPTGEKRCEAWRSYINEMQQYYHALLPEARRADSLGMKLDIPTPKLYTPSEYNFMNEYYLNWAYLDFTETITELYY